MIKLDFVVEIGGWLVVVVVVGGLVIGWGVVFSAVVEAKINW